MIAKEKPYTLRDGEIVLTLEPAEECRYVVTSRIFTNY